MPDNKKDGPMKGRVKSPQGADMPALAVVLVRGLVGSRHEVRDTLHMLRLHRKNTCVILPNVPSVQGMLRKAKDYLTWGTIDLQTRQKLAEKGSTRKDKMYHLSPPRRGFGRKGIKTTFLTGGALGDRGDRINDLLLRMM